VSNRAHVLTLGDRAMTISEWARQPESIARGLTSQVIRQRLQEGWPVELALTLGKGRHRSTAHDAPHLTARERARRAWTRHGAPPTPQSAAEAFEDVHGHPRPESELGERLHAAIARLEVEAELLERAARARSEGRA
jgi:hypothetical protein